MTALRTIVVVGASLAGLRAAEALRRQGFEGRLTLVGAETHRPYDRPPLSKQVLAGDWEPEQTVLRSAFEDGGLELDLRLGTRADALDLAERCITLAGGDRLDFDGLVIATGGRPRRLPGDVPAAGVHVLRTLDDALALRDELERSPRVAVIGAGFIGAEVAATCRGRGLDVTLIEALPVPLALHLGSELGEVCAAIHRDHGVDLRCGVGVASIDGEARVEGVTLADGSRVDADVVVLGIGMEPVTDWLQGSGLKLEDGVLCDETCAASAPGVVAAGDVARWRHPLFGETLRVEHWTNAVEQADAAAKRLLAGDGALETYAAVPYFWSDQYDRKIQFAGRARPDDELRIVSGSPAERRFVALFGRAGRLVGAFALNRPPALMRYKQRIAEGAAWDEVIAQAEGA